MYRRLNILLTAVLFFIASFPIFAEGNSTGLYMGMKGVGVVFERECSERIYNSYVLYLDSYYLATDGDKAKLGARFDFTHNKMYPLAANAERALHFIAGAGVSAGYISDYETATHSLCPSLAFRCGLRAIYGRRMNLEIAWQADLGLALREERSGEYVSSLYKDGLRHAWVPQIKIMFRF